jgi:hypothetical protein
MKKNIVLIAVLTSAFINIKVNMAQAPKGKKLASFP